MKKTNEAVHLEKIAHSTKIMAYISADRSRKELPHVGDTIRMTPTNNISEANVRV
jgi:hypothetical protein